MGMWRHWRSSWHMIKVIDAGKRNQYNRVVYTVQAECSTGPGDTHMNNGEYMVLTCDGEEVHSNVQGTIGVFDVNQVEVTQGAQVLLDVLRRYWPKLLVLPVDEGHPIFMVRWACCCFDSLKWRELTGTRSQDYFCTLESCERIWINYV